MYKQAARLHLRIPTVRGQLSVEQLWGLPLKELDQIATGLQEEYKKSGKKSFLIKKSAKDKLLKLKFDVVLDILVTLAEEAEAAKDTAANKLHNDRILSKIAEAQDRKLDGLDEEALLKLLK